MRQTNLINNEKSQLVDTIESIALDMSMRLESCDSFNENEPDYWFFYHMLCTFEQMITDIHQYQMLDKLS